MKVFYKEYKDILNLPVSLANLIWTHNYTLIEKEKDKLSVKWVLEATRDIAKLYHVETKRVNENSKRIIR